MIQWYTTYNHLILLCFGTANWLSNRSIPLMYSNVLNDQEVIAALVSTIEWSTEPWIIVSRRRYMSKKYASKAYCICHIRRFTLTFRRLKISEYNRHGSRISPKGDSLRSCSALHSHRLSPNTLVMTLREPAWLLSILIGHQGWIYFRITSACIAKGIVGLPGCCRIYWTVQWWCIPISSKLRRRPVGCKGSYVTPHLPLGLTKSASTLYAIPYICIFPG